MTGTLLDTHKVLTNLVHIYSQRKQSVQIGPLTFEAQYNHHHLKPRTTVT